MAKRLLISGMVLFLLGLLNGITIPFFENPRMGLSAHLAGVQNALVLLAFGLMWKYCNFSKRAETWCVRLSLYSMYSIWIALALAAIWGTSRATPIAGEGYSGLKWQELIVDILLYSGSIAIIIATVQIIIALIKSKVWSREEP